jgi:cysteinyl-tRNA synthetase
VGLYTCGPTVYNFQHVGNYRTYVFEDILVRTLERLGYQVQREINITDVGHLTDDADAGEDKLERAAAQKKQTARELADHYAHAYWADFRALNCREPAQWSIATDYVPRMIEFAQSIAANCYELPGGLYFDTSTVPDYGRLARASTDEGESRIDPVEGKRHAADFAIWRKTPPGETRQMEWDSPWGRGAPGWHLECSVMSGDLLGFPFDIHTGGIDHREIHHPNEIAQNQAFCRSDATGANIWMHNNFLVERTGKMSKSAGEFLRLQLLIDKGYHPLAYRLMCLQAHYRSELEFSWEGLGAAFTRLKRMVMAVDRIKENAADAPDNPDPSWEKGWLDVIDETISDDLSTVETLLHLEELIGHKPLNPREVLGMVENIDSILGLDLLNLTRADLRLRPKDAAPTDAEIEAALARRKAARAERDFATSDAIRAELAVQGVEVMDGDPLGWEWKLGD